MKGIILNNNKALVLDVTEVKYDNENNNMVKITTNGATIYSGINNTVLIRGSQELANQIAQSLIGTEGELTVYNSKERTFRSSVVNKTSERNAKSRELSLKNKTE